MTPPLAGTRPLHALVYGDVNLNLVDGSAIWVQSMAQALVATGVRVTLLLKARVRTTRLLDPITDLPGVTVVPSGQDGGWLSRGESLTPAGAARALVAVDERDRADLLVLRGRRIAVQVVAEGRFDGRLWTYLTDVPQHIADLTEDTVTELTRVAAASRFLLCQTEELRGFLETVVPAAAGRSVLFPPVVAEPDPPVVARPAPGRELSLVYTGKFAPRWRTLEMSHLPAALRARGVHATVHMVGDKIHDDPANPSYAADMRTALATSAGVVWHGGVSREEAMRVAAGCDVGLCWRHPSLDASLELSTKLLEFGMLGLPVIVNRTPMHEDLLGVDYPLFAANEAEVLDAVCRMTSDRTAWMLAAERCRAASAGYRLSTAAGRLRRMLTRAFPPATSSAGSGRRLRLGIAGHDLKFLTGLLTHFSALPDVDVRIDEWPALSANDAARTKEIQNWADVVIVEWCGPAAVHYSRHKRPGQRLLVRLHRFELYSPYPKDVDIDAVDAVICVSPHYAALTRDLTGWPADKVVMLPNWVDVDLLDRPKLPGAQYHLGFIGVAPMRKRVDLAVTVLAELRRRDTRYRLFAKTRMPWDYWWIWKKPEERAHINGVLRRVQGSESLRGAVVFDAFGADVGRWLRTVGFVLSTSDDESFHLAPAEGMASGAVPALLRWPGADTVYDRRWISDSPAALGDAVHEIVASGRWDAERRLAQEQARAAFDLPTVCDLWTRLLREDLR